MRATTKTQAIARALVDGNKLTVKTCMVLCGTYKISSRLGELEKRYGLNFERKWIKSASRYGGVDEYLEYSVNNSNRKKLTKLLLEDKI